MSAVRTVLLISYHFYPSTEIGARRVTALARYLTNQGIRVIVVSEFGGKPMIPGSELWPGAVCVPVAMPRRLLIDTLVRIKAKRSGPTNAADQKIGVNSIVTEESRPLLRTRVRDVFFNAVYFIDTYKRWSWRASKAAKRAARDTNVDAIVASGPPHSVLIAAARAARHCKVPFIADFRDPWADGASIKSRRSPRLRLLRKLESWTLHSAAAITSTGATVARSFSTLYPDLASRIHVIRNGFDGEIKPPLLETGGRLSVLFAGELYAGRNPFPLLSALETLVNEPGIDSTKIHVTFMGRCETYAGKSLKEWLAGRQCEGTVTILPQMPQEAVSRATSEATVLLNLAQRQPLSVPAKTFEHLASGREILLVCEDDSETAHVVSGISGVTQVDDSRPDILLKVLKDLYQRHVLDGRATVPRTAEVAPFSRESANEKFLGVIASVATTRRTS